MSQPVECDLYLYANDSCLLFQQKNVAENYLGCVLDETMLDEAVALRENEKMNYRLKFLYWKNQFLDVPLRRLLCNALIQSQLDYTCTVEYPNLTKKLKDKLQVM